MNTTRYYTDEEITEILSRYKFYHIIPINDRISTPGVLEFSKLHPPIFRQMGKIDFLGKSVLDVGCRDGLFSFEAEKAGAGKVLGIDNCLSLGAVEFLIPYFQSKVQMLEKGLFDLNPELDGQFDIVLFLGVLYHLRYPFEALRIISDLVRDKGTLLLETAIFKDENKRPLLFCPTGEESPYEPSSVTFFNLKGLINTINSFGFSVQEIDYISNEDRQRSDGSIV